MNIEYGPDDEKDFWEFDRPPKVWSRAEWGALPAKSTAPINHPVKYIRFTHTGGDQCISHEQCIALIQKLQRDHMFKENLPDIKYSFLIGGDEARVYEGRGWHSDAIRPKKLDKIRGNAIDIAFIGNYTDYHYPRIFEMSALVVGKIGMVNKFISQDLEIISFDGTVVISPPSPEE